MLALFNTYGITFLLILFIILGIVGHNQSVTLSAIVLLFVQQTPLNKYAPLLEQYGLKLGIIILTIGVLSPLITGKIKSEDLVNIFQHWQTVAAVIVGILVAWLGGRGVGLITTQPTIVTGLLIGTIIGVAFFRGVPVGPLIAAGILSVVLWKV